MTAANRYFNLDLCRAVAVLLVTLYHVRLVHNGYVGVDMFFVLSGYTMMMTWRGDIGDFLRRRFLRIYPAFFAAVLIWSAINRPSAEEIAVHLLFINNMDPSYIRSINVVLWSLAVEMQFYLLFPVLVVMRWRWRLALVALSFVYIWAMGWHDHWTIHRARTENLVGFLPLFLLGMALYEGRLGWLPWLMPVAAVLFWLPEPDLGPWHMYRRMFIGAVAASVFVVLVTRTQPAGWVFSGLSSIGLASYSMYLHNIIYRPAGIEDQWLGAGFALVVGYLAYLLIERPLGRVFRLRRRGAAPESSAVS